MMFLKLGSDTCGESKEVGHVQSIWVQRMFLQDCLKSIHRTLDVLESK